MSRFHVENIWLFWQLSLGINHGIDTYLIFWVYHQGKMSQFWDGFPFLL